MVYPAKADTVPRHQYDTLFREYERHVGIVLEQDAELAELRSFRDDVRAMLPVLDMHATGEAAAPEQGATMKSDAPCRAMIRGYSGARFRCRMPRIYQCHDRASRSFDHEYQPPRTVAEWLRDALGGGR